MAGKWAVGSSQYRKRLSAGPAESTVELVPSSLQLDGANAREAFGIT